MAEPDEEGFERTAHARLREDGKRRRAGEPDYSEPGAKSLKRWFAIAASLPAVGMVIFTVTNVWFQSDAEAQTAQAAVMADQATLGLDIARERERNNTQDVILGQINGKLDRGEILALKAERRGLKAEIEGSPQGDIRRRLELQLESVEEDLRLKGVQ